MSAAPAPRVPYRRWSAHPALRIAVAVLTGAALAACSGTTTATPIIGSTTVSTSSSASPSPSPSAAPSTSIEPAEITSTSVTPFSEPPASPSPDSMPASSPASSVPAAATGECVGPFGYSGQTATLVATQGELTCEEMTAAWNLFLAEFPERSGQVITTSAGWTCTWIDGPGPRPDAVEGDEGGPGCIREGKAFGPLLGGAGGTGSNGGTEAGDCTITGDNGNTLRIEDSTVSCTEAKRIWDLPALDSFGKRVSKGEGWECAYGGAGDGWVSGCSNESTGDQFGLVPIDSGSSGSGDPGSSGGSGSVTTPLSNLSCDGTGIVLLTAAVTPGAYQQDIDAALAANPGASVLRTDRSCSSLAPVTDAGDPIYAIYLPTGSSDRDTVCAAVTSAGGDAYGKWLDAGLSPDESRIDC